MDSGERGPYKPSGSRYQVDVALGYGMRMDQSQHLKTVVPKSYLMKVP